MRKHRFGIAGLSLLTALGLMAFSVTLAQAETGANWRVNGANINATLLPEVQINEIEVLPGTAERHLVMLTMVGASPVELLCSGMTLEETKLKTSGSSLGKGRFTGCIIFINGKLSTPCEPHSGKGKEEEAGVILTRLLKGLIVLHLVSPGVTSTLNRIEPEEGNIIVTLTLGKGEGGECAIGQAASITGKLYLEDCNAEFQIEAVKHLFIQGPLTALSFLGGGANIDGSVWAQLVGAMHAGLKWSGTPA